MNEKPPDPGIRPAQPGLFRHGNFVLLWIGETTSRLGNSLATLALPLIAVLSLSSSTFGVAVLAASVWVPWLVLGLPAGAWVDRHDPALRRSALVLIHLVYLFKARVFGWLAILARSDAAAARALSAAPDRDPGNLAGLAPAPARAMPLLVLLN